MMKKILIFLLTALLCTLLFFGCSRANEDTVANQDQESANASGLEMHKIGVATYDVRDAQIMMFKDYLDNYIKECFSDVTFLYSETLSGSDDLMNFLEYCAENEVEGLRIL